MKRNVNKKEDRLNKKHPLGGLQLIKANAGKIFLRIKSNLKLKEKMGNNR